MGDASATPSPGEPMEDNLNRLEATFKSSTQRTIICISKRGYVRGWTEHTHERTFVSHLAASEVSRLSQDLAQWTGRQQKVS